MGSGSKSYSGTVKGTGSLITVAKEKGGVTPHSVKLVRDDGLGTLEWSESMGDDKGMLTDSTGGDKGTPSMLASAGVTPIPGGFTIGTNAVINSAGKIIHYTADY